LIGLNQITQLAATSAFVTGIYGITRNTPRMGVLVGTAGINSGITAGTFFGEPNEYKSCTIFLLTQGIREFGISPILTHVAPWRQYARRRQELGIGNSLDDVPFFEKLSWSDLRANRLLDSGVAGAVTGGLLRGVKSVHYLTSFFYAVANRTLQAGRHAVVSGAITASAVCILLQYACNELGIVRLRYISTLQEENKLLIMQPSFKPQNGKQVYEPSGSVFQQILKAVGLIPVSDEEYLAKLKRTREVYLKRMAELEQQAEEEKTTKMS
jgi:hypothetical protein